MIGAIIGDIIGSVYEFSTMKTKKFDLFSNKCEVTDDSILTIAVFLALEKCNGDYSNLGELTAKEFKRLYIEHPYPMGSYGSSFEKWVLKSIKENNIQPPYNSYGNGSAMRVSPVAYFADNLEQCIELSKKVTEITHNHPEGIKGAEATAVATYLALEGKSMEEIKTYIVREYYSLDKSLKEIRSNYGFDGSCQGTVPESLQAFFEAKSYEDAIRNTISLGGDADTMGAITGAIAEAYFGIPKSIETRIYDYIDKSCVEIIKRMQVLRNNVIETKKII